MTTYDNNMQQPNYEMQSNTGIIDRIYLKSMGGILKAVELVCSICVGLHVYCLNSAIDVF